MHRRIMLIGLVAPAALLAFESAPPALAQTQHLTRFAINPKEVEIQGYARSNESCDVLELPQIYLDVPPENGVVCGRFGKVIARVIAEIWDGCCALAQLLRQRRRFEPLASGPTSLVNRSRRTVAKQLRDPPGSRRRNTA